jgi:hypothetical protein
MATVPVTADNRQSAYGAATPTANLCTAQVGNGASTNIADRGAVGGGPGILRVITTIGATPTCTYLVEGSADGTNWFAAPIALVTAPETVSVATFVITTAATSLFHIRPNHAWRYLRVTFSANTNVTNTVDVFLTT